MAIPEHIIPCKALIGCKVAYEIGRYTLVSPAIYSLLEDDSIRDGLMKQVEVIDLEDVILNELLDRLKNG